VIHISCISMDAYPHLIRAMQSFIFDTTSVPELRVNISYYRNSEGELVPEYKLKEIYTEEKFSWKSLVSDMGHRMMIMGVVRPGVSTPILTPFKNTRTFEIKVGTSLSVGSEQGAVGPQVDHSLNFGCRSALVLAMMGTFSEET
jgi:hypothetical protein